MVDIYNQKKVDFVIAGVQKGGTRALGAYLRQHPDICMSAVKEVHFFDKEPLFSERMVDYSIYHSFFSQCDPNKIWGETTPIYIYWEQARARLFEYNPNMKFIISLRNPITRAYSHWNMETSRGAEHLSFSNAIEVEERRARKKLPFQDRVHSYVDRGFYANQIKQIWRFFPKHQTLIIKSEDLLNSHQETLNQITDFLKIERMIDVTPHSVHVRKYAEKMDKNDVEVLLNLYKEDIKELEALLNWDCSDWLNLETLDMTLPKANFEDKKMVKG